MIKEKDQLYDQPDEAIHRFKLEITTIHSALSKVIDNLMENSITTIFQPFCSVYLA